MTPRLTRRVALEEKTATPDGGGGQTVSWASKGTLWAEIRKGSGREALIGGRAASRITHRVRVRGAPVGSPRRPEADQRLRLGARIFDILAVTEDDDQGAFLNLWVIEGPLS
ncbi:MAG: phage head closure protein [Pseudomonadota bacterium]